MSEAPDWRQKYRDSLLEMESEEKRWQQTEHALRRLVGRLCAAAMGVAPDLDDELIILAEANRRNADAAELEKLAESLTTAVVAVDAVSPVPTIITAAPFRRWDSTCAATGKILRHLGSLCPDDAAPSGLMARLANANSDAELAAILEKTAELVRAHGDSAARERLQAVAVLADVTTRLDEMADYLTASGDDARLRSTDTAAVNDQVISQVHELTAEINGATELRVLQSVVASRLEKVSRCVLDFRSRDERRAMEQATRAERLRARIADLERETQALHSRLAEEKQGARHDVLTRLANRTTFDERFARAVQQAQSDQPIALLLWDVDDFKAINEAYGHRVGDRVLKSVATCLAAGVPAQDLVARVGGEEFAMLLTGLPFEQVRQLAEQVRIAVQDLRLHFRGTPVRITVSCGLTDLRRGDRGNAAFERADAALRRVKSAGKNHCLGITDI